VTPSTNGRATEPTFFAAADLANAGYPVFPVGPSKAPSVEGGFYAATTDVSQVAEWITEGRDNHDVAVATGIASGVVVIDADTAEAYAKMAARYGPPHARTRRGGHWYFGHPKNGKVASRPLDGGLDCKGDGGYVVAPPSRGRTWTDGIPDIKALPPLPPEFWSAKASSTNGGRTMAAPRKDAATEVIAQSVAKVLPGKRHEHLKHLCGVLLSRDVSGGDAEDILIAAWAKVGGDLAERAPKEVPNTIRTTLAALAEGRATGVPRLEEITPGLYEELEEVFGWRIRVTFGGKERRGKGQEDDGQESSGDPLPWPELPEEALYGLPGDVVRAIESHSEADPAALLANTLCAFGNVLGRGAFARVGADEHHPKLFIGLVGKTAKGRKGVSWGPVRDLARAVDPGWAENRVVSGLSSGEGLIYAVRDEVRGMKKDEEVVLDPGEKDKRLLVLEGELSNVLKVMGRDGNTLSPIIRQAWDGDRLRTLTKNNPTKSTGAHVSIIGHITKAELLRHLNETEAANGFANRFLWLMVRRSKELPFGGQWDVATAARLVQRLDSAVRFGRRPRVIRWGRSAGDVWGEVYGPLSEGKPGLLGAVVGRAEAQALRLAVLHAVMDESETIEYEHLAAALGLWEYAEESARYIFGDATGDPVADDLLEALRAAGEDGLTRTEIRDLFGRHKSSERINQALGELRKLGRVEKAVEQTGGRPTERWFSK
jgi:hypothetical protein